jgi:hypothetical protein
MSWSASVAGSRKGVHGGVTVHVHVVVEVCVGVVHPWVVGAPVVDCFAQTP